jgi:hypothetical protein
MKAVGIGGLQNFDVNLNTPQVVDKRLVYMTPEWKDAFRFAAQEADRTGWNWPLPHRRAGAKRAALGSSLPMG